MKPKVNANGFSSLLGFDFCLILGNSQRIMCVYLERDFLAMRWLLVFCATLCIHGALSQSTEADHAETDILELDPGNARALLGKGAEASVDHTTTTEVDHKRTARAEVQEGEALTFPAGENAHKTTRAVNGRVLLNKATSTTNTQKKGRGTPKQRGKKLTQDNFEVDSRCTKFGALPSNQTCPDGYRITPGTLVNKRVYKHGVCTSVQTVLCQCGAASCPTATCKTYSPKIHPFAGKFMGVTAGNGALYKSNFSAWSHTNLSAAVEKKVISTIMIWSEAFIKIRAGEIAACGKSIERDTSATSATGTDLASHCSTRGTRAGLKCCLTSGNSSGLFDSHLPLKILGSDMWEDTPTRCTLDNPLVQLFYSNLGPMDLTGSGRIPMPSAGHASVNARVEVAQLEKYVKSALETTFPGEQVATNISSADVGIRHGNHFAIVIGAGQRNVVGRRLLGGPFQNNTGLNQKLPGWYGCEVKYLAMVSVSPAQPRCVKNDRGGDLCEPKMAGSLLLWMESDPTDQSVSMSKLYRPNNNAATCARVDTAVRLALTKYRFELSASERLNEYQKAAQLK